MNTDELIQIPRYGKISWESEYRTPLENETMFVKTTRADDWDKVFFKNGEPTRRYFDVNGDERHKRLFLWWPEVDKGDYKYAFLKEDTRGIEEMRKHYEEERKRQLTTNWWEVMHPKG